MQNTNNSYFSNLMPKNEQPEVNLKYRNLTLMRGEYALCF